MHRHISTTRPTSQEAAAAAVAPPPAPPPRSMQMASMAAEMKRQQEQRQNGSLGAPPQSMSIFQSARRIIAAPGSPPQQSPTAWAGASKDRLKDSWKNDGKSILPYSKTNKAISDLGISNDYISKPNADDIDSDAALQLVKERPIDVKYRLHPVIGRTVEIGGRVDVARGLALLSMQCATNKVKLDFNKQRFHERPGMKKKRLHRERWRARFKAGFKATCKRVRNLASQGW